MIEIFDYNTSLIKINDANTNIFFLDKDGLSVSGVNGNLVLVNSSNESRTYPFANIKTPSETTLDELVVVIREYIDNV